MSRSASLRWRALRSVWQAVERASAPGSPGLVDRLRCLPRLVRATFAGQYAGTSRRRLLLQAAALAYIVSPLDLVPEALLSVLGLADDAMVLAWLAAGVVNDTEDFLAFEDRHQTVRSRAV